MPLTNAQKQANFRAKKKAEKEALLQAGGVVAGAGTTGASTAVPAGAEEPGLKINIKAEATTPHKPSLRERLGLGGGAKAAAPVKRSAKKSDKPNLVVTLLPTLLASLVAAWAKDRVPDEYKPCAPSQAEVSAMIGPLMNIIGRRIEVAAQVSQDAIDLTNALICGMAYGVRAYVTYVDIKKAKETGQSYAQKQQKRGEDYQAKLDREVAEYETVTSEPNLAGGLRSYQAAANGTDSYSVGSNGQRSGGAINGADSNGAGDPANDSQLRDYEASLVAQMFARDKRGRQQLGLLPRAI